MHAPSTSKMRQAVVEVFKTNVGNATQAETIVEKIQMAFEGYEINFDLDDCDKILRVKSQTGIIQSTRVISILRDAGFDAEVLPDDCPAGTYWEEFQA